MEDSVHHSVADMEIRVDWRTNFKCPWDMRFEMETAGNGVMSFQKKFLAHNFYMSGHLPAQKSVEDMEVNCSGYAIKKDGQEGFNRVSVSVKVRDLPEWLQAVIKRDINHALGRE